MKHLIVCPEFPPAPVAGGIGTYVQRISRLLAESGETVHVIARRWRKAPARLETRSNGRLLIHRVGEVRSLQEPVPAPGKWAEERSALKRSAFPPQEFAFQAGLLAEELVEQEGIDIIEGQEFEAPLYFLQLRRALGMGPRRRPPCLVHLHSPMEIIVEHNDWDIHEPYFRTAKRLEDYSILAADAHLCPSRYLAGQAEACYGLDLGSVHVIPLPVDHGPTLQRDKETWARGTVLHVGRLERRKGILEWLEAAIPVARENPELRLAFVGANCLGTDRTSGPDILARLIPRDLAPRFQFHGERKPRELPRFLAEARIAVVPSRWENFPNACVEAMSSGLPVIASASGGTAEMVEAGRTGWLSSDPGPDGLRRALRRALGTPQETLEEMGRAAALAIRKRCDNRRVLKEHLALRERVAERAAARSLVLPDNLPWASPGVSDRPRRCASDKDAARGIAMVLVCSHGARGLRDCLATLKNQSRAKVQVVIIDDSAGRRGRPAILEEARRQGATVLSRDPERAGSPEQLGIQHVLEAGVRPKGFCFLRPEERLKPGFAQACQSVFDHCPEVGIVSGWVHFSQGPERAWTWSCPAFPYQWVWNEIAPFAALRTDALLEVGGFPACTDREYATWELFNGVLRAGWVGITYPAIMGYGPSPGSPYARNHLGVNRHMRQGILTGAPDAASEAGQQLVLLAEANAAHLLRQQYGTPEARVSRALSRLALRLRKLASRPGVGKRKREAE